MTTPTDADSPLQNNGQLVPVEADWVQAANHHPLPR